MLGFDKTQSATRGPLGLTARRGQANPPTVPPMRSNSYRTYTAVGQRPIGRVLVFSLDDARSAIRGHQQRIIQAVPFGCGLRLYSNPSLRHAPATQSLA
jgi:hypothetical protein